LYAIANPLYDRYRLVLLSSTTRRVFAERIGSRLCLPRLSIPRWTRAAEQVQKAIESTWGIRGIILDFLGEEPGSEGIVIAELIVGIHEHKLSTLQSWADLNDVPTDEFDRFERDAVETLLQDGQTGRGPFSRFGWIKEATRWIGNDLGRIREPLTSELLQLNAGPNHALIRFGKKEAPLLWLKAVADPSDHEYHITKVLASIAPEYLPQIVASREDWKAWCMEDAGGPLEGSLDVDLYNRVVRRLAELQIASIPHVNGLLAKGYHDLRLTVLGAQIPQMIERAQEAMGHQCSRFAPRLGPSRFGQLGTRLEEACAELAELNIPDTLMHGDISLDNILVGRQDCVFTDWARASIGNPFVTFERLRGQLAQDPTAHPWLTMLIENYRESWRPLLSQTQINRALRLTPTVAAAIDLFTQCESFRQDRTHEFQMCSSLRAMARNLDRAVAALELNRNRCA
jgi:hypothetical protein